MLDRRLLGAATLAAALLLAVAGASADDAPAPRNTPPADAAEAARTLAPLWADDGYAQARLALQRLSTADRDGLQPADYAVATPLPAGSAAPPAQAARFQIELTEAVLRFLADLHGGRTRPAFTVSGIALAPRHFDPVTHLDAALRQRRLPDAFAAAEPDSALYARVKQALAQYRALAPRHRQLPPLPGLQPGPGLKPGAPYAGAAALHARLALLGDTAPEAQPETEATYSDALSAAVLRFQQRHGLLQDGVLGKKTMAALAVPLAQRIAQLELTLERLRWMPALPPGPLIVVNIPSFRLWALDTRQPGAQPLLDTRVIVGAAARTPTPLFLGALRHLEFNPAWNVPHSITRGEIIPKLAADPAYLHRNDMELVAGDGQVVAAGASALAMLRAGQVRVRQRPGARNVLGAVKFAMPNPMHIYLHSTSARELFHQARRDLSHGCIRVEQPAALAEFVLRHETGWDRASIAAAMAPGPTETVRLAAPIPVVLFYATALVERNGRVLFLDDIYGHDRKLALALGLADATARGQH
jgi:murein L,D-transpeptidase YcbB/YkuD